MTNAYWATEAYTWKIYADTPEEARDKFERYVWKNEHPKKLDMKCKAVELTGEWSEEE